MSEAYSVIYSPEAVNDLREIYSYIVFYTVTDDTQAVTIIRIVYGGRDVEGIASETNNV